MKPLDRLMEYYTYFFYLLCFGAIAASLSYTFRMVRGSYGSFILSDDNALSFFFAAMLISSALFAAVTRALGPVGMSASLLFWRYPGRAKLPRNPWVSPVNWGALVLWGLLAVLLATILAPFSPGWLVGAATAALAMGFVLVQWALADQLLPRTALMGGWAVVTAVAGITLTVLATAFENAASPDFFMLVTAVLVGTAALLTVVTNLLAFRNPMTWEKAVAGDARRALVLNAISSVGSPDGYKFYGTKQGFLQAKFRSTKPAAISLLAALDSLFIMLAVLALSVPLGIFFATSFSTLGIGVTLAVGSWLIALLFRWHAREWTAQASLRTWLGAPNLKTLLGFCAGSSLMTALYVLGMTAIFDLPWHLPLVGMLLGFFVALGEVNPPRQINYELVITTPDGIMVPIEPVFMVLRHLVIIAVVSFALYLGVFASLLMLLVMVICRLLTHYLGMSLGDYFARIIYS